MKAPVNTTLFIGFLAVVLLLWQEHQNEVVWEAIYVEGKAKGHALAVAEMSDKTITDKACLAWWFGNDPQRVGKAIQKVKVSQ